MLSKNYNRKSKIMEKDVLRLCIDWLTLTKWCVFRLNNVGVYNPRTRSYFFKGRRGLPDIMAFKPKKPVLFVECKREKGKLTQEQKDTLEIINQTLSIGICVHSLEELQQKTKDL